MKSIKLIYSLLLLAAVALASASEPNYRTDINPALRYYLAFILAPEVSTADRDYLMTNQWRGQKLPERFGELVSRYDNQFKLVRQAAHATVPSDFGIDWSAGPETLLPHLARIKGVAQMARLRAMWDLQNGRQAEACDDLLAALALGRNGAQDGYLIAALVQIATEAIVCNTVAENFDRFSPEILRRFVEGIDAAPARGTIASCIAMEKASSHDWLAAKISGWQKDNQGNDAKVMEKIHEFFDLVTSSEGEQRDRGIWQRVLNTSGGTSDGVLKLVHDSAALYSRLEEILTLPRAQYEEQMKQFSSVVHSSSNPLVGVMFPAIEKCRPKEFGALVKLAMLRAAVEIKLNGPAGLKSVMDPCGDGPFELQRFVFEGVDRGFSLKSAYDGRGFPETFIFVEKEGTQLLLDGPRAGQPLEKSGN
jgi:hypothetical protein